MTWEETKDPEYPYSAKVNQDNYLIRLNDFPDESLYTLIVNNEEIEDLEDWPERWIICSDSRRNDGPPHEALSDPEREVMRLLASGKSVREIAEVLSCTHQAVTRSIARIAEKMDMKTSAELTQYALQNSHNQTD
ncbi:MAG: helix-turn-helix transcriptional regulator [Acidobacteriota bacterium]